MRLNEIVEGGFLIDLIDTLLSKGEKVFAAVLLHSDFNHVPTKHKVQITKIIRRERSVDAEFKDPASDELIYFELLDSDDDDLEIVKWKGAHLIRYRDPTKTIEV